MSRLMVFEKPGSTNLVRLSLSRATIDKKNGWVKISCDEVDLKMLNNSTKIFAKNEQIIQRTFNTGPEEAI